MRIALNAVHASLHTNTHIETINTNKDLSSELVAGRQLLEGMAFDSNGDELVSWIEKPFPEKSFTAINDGKADKVPMAFFRVKWDAGRTDIT